MKDANGFVDDDGFLLRSEFERNVIDVSDYDGFKIFVHMKLL